jgi:hypothetical protein
MRKPRLALWRWLAAGLGTLALVVGLTACGRTSASGPGGAGTGGDTVPASDAKLAPDLKTLLQQVLQRQDLSAFEREVLTRAVAAGSIATADYEEAHSRYARCVKDAGITETYVKLSNGVYEMHPEQPEGVDSEKYNTQLRAATKRCAIGTLAAIEALFRTQQANPGLLANNFQVAAQCLVKVGAAPATYNGDSLKSDLQNNFAKAPFKVMEPKAHECLSAAGFAIAVAATTTGQATPKTSAAGAAG